VQRLLMMVIVLEVLLHWYRPISPKCEYAEQIGISSCLQWGGCCVSSMVPAEEGAVGWYIQAVLDVAGIQTNGYCDCVNALFYAARGQWGNAGIVH
jgi:hypothetical protein